MIIQWRKSTRSDDYGNCIELAALPDAIAIRDSRAPDIGHLTLTPQAFGYLLTQLKRDELT
ncbi:DUF397 domain-containing protein [Actinomadura sp. 6K520]|jgi:hypothetical protein|uniref:DUF397 domain-containing protein n=1 Tax=Actinomadura sp. 6K520 TaxID=2530364 RepID=UPI0010494F10|nr:DUF397 domain-containing protein [Actinomadura sp. 6K520]TDE32529.1 DUF397 domain-containing protein [Actinomadura sp. 6K520]